MGSLFHQKIKAVKLTWSQAWRRMNKKGKMETNKSKNKKKVQKFQKAIVGMSLEDMRRKRAEKPTLRAAQKEAAVKEAKARQAKKGTKPAGNSKANQSAPKGKTAAPQKNMGGGAKKDFKGRK